MKKENRFLKLFVSFLFIICLYLGLTNPGNDEPGNTEPLLKISENENAMEESEGSSEVERENFEKEHNHGPVIGQKMLESIWKDIKRMPNEKDFGNSVTTWTPLGPYGSQIPGH